MKVKKMMSLLLSIILIFTQFTVSFAAVNDNAKMVLKAGEIIDGKYTVILIAENCLDLTECDLQISYDNSLVEFVPYDSYIQAEPMSDVMNFNKRIGSSRNSFSAETNLNYSSNSIASGFYFLESLNPEKWEVDVNIENVQVLCYYFNLSDENIREVEFTLTGSASFWGRDRLLFDENFIINLPCKNNHIDENFDLICDLCKEEYDVCLGDVNFDGEISAEDACLAYRSSLDIVTLTDTQRRIADVIREDSDSHIITSADGRLICRASVGLEDTDNWTENVVTLTDASDQYGDSLFLEIIEDDSTDLIVGIFTENISDLASYDIEIKYDSDKLSFLQLSLNEDYIYSSSNPHIADVYQFADDSNGTLKISGGFIETCGTNEKKLLHTVSFSVIQSPAYGTSNVSLSAKAYIMEYNDNYNLACAGINDSLEIKTELSEGFYNLGNFSCILANGEMTYIGYAEPAKEINIPDTILGYPVTAIAEKAFNANNITTDILIPASVKDISSQAFDSKKIESITVAEDNQYYSSVDGVLFNKDKTELIKYPSSKKDVSYIIPDSVKTIADNAFSECEYLENLTISENVSFEDAYRFAYKVFNCVKLKSISVAAGNTSFMCEDGVLYNKDKTALLLYPAAKKNKSFTVPEGVKDIEMRAFSNNKFIEEIVMLEGFEMLNTSALEDCTSLKKVTLPESVNFIAYRAFGNCSAIETVYFGGDIIQWAGWNGASLGNDYLWSADVVCAKKAQIIENSENIKTGNNGQILVTPENTVDDIFDSVDPNVFISCQLLVSDVSGNEVEYDAKLASGMKLIIKNSNGDILVENTLVVPCDVNGDASVSASDARVALRSSVGLEELNDWQKAAADIESNNQIQASDARTILRASVGLENMAELFNKLS